LISCNNIASLENPSKLIGKNLKSNEIINVFENLGNKTPKIEYIDQTPNFDPLLPWYYVSYENMGINFSFNQKSNLVSIHYLIKLDNSSSMKRVYDGNLPFGISKNFSRKEVEKIIGKQDHYLMMIDTIAVYFYKNLEIVVGYDTYSRTDLENSYMRYINISQK
jgi:hypothetical protein